MKNLEWRVLEFSKNSASKNMAVDEAIFRLYDDLKFNTIRFYGWDPSAVSIGRHQAVENEVNLENLKKYGYDIVRRISGGGAVFHDSFGELTYSIVTDVNYLSSKSIEATYYELANIVFSPLKKLGLNLDYNQIHCPSVFSRGKKISGNAQARHKNTILQHGTILIKIRPEIMYSVLKARPRRTRESMIESVYQNIITLSELIETDFTPEKIGEYLLKHLLENNSTQFFRSTLKNEEEAKAEDLKLNRYEKKEWLYPGDSQQYFQRNFQIRTPK
jgi:lipoate-protein ligase A